MGASEAAAQRFCLRCCNVCICFRVDCRPGVDSFPTRIPRACPLVVGRCLVFVAVFLAGHDLFLVTSSCSSPAVGLLCSAHECAALAANVVGPGVARSPRQAFNTSPGDLTASAAWTNPVTFMGRQGFRGLAPDSEVWTTEEEDAACTRCRRPPGEPNSRARRRRGRHHGGRARPPTSSSGTRSVISGTAWRWRSGTGADPHGGGGRTAVGTGDPEVPRRQANTSSNYTVQELHRHWASRPSDPMFASRRRARDLSARPQYISARTFESMPLPLLRPAPEPYGSARIPTMGNLTIWARRLHRDGLWRRIAPYDRGLLGCRGLHQWAPHEPERARETCASHGSACREGRTPCWAARARCRGVTLGFGCAVGASHGVPKCATFAGYPRQPGAPRNIRDRTRLVALTRSYAYARSSERIEPTRAAT